MKIAIIGTGAMGSIYAALMADAGNEVWAVDLWQEHLDAIRDNGLRVEGASGDRAVHSINVTTDASEIGPCDLIIVSTKAAGVESAARAIAPIVSENTAVLAMQNGLGAGDRISQYLPAKNILLGVAKAFGASMKGPGHAHHNGMERIYIGEMNIEINVEMNDGLSERVERIAQFWRDAGFDVQAFADINQLIWDKFICNVAFSAPCTVFDGTLGEMMDDADTWRVCTTCATEAFEAGRAKGINLTFDDPVAHVTAFGNKLRNARPSMLLDHHARRRSEIDAINGMVPVVAAQVGTKAPYNELLTTIVKAREAEF